MKLSLSKFILIGILVLAAFLRLWNLSHVPPSASMDEASISYNAYSVLKTGGDEYGDLPDLSHRSYDDWRRATYLYMVVPFVAVFDLQVLAVRLPVVILSLFTIVASYYICLYLFQKRSNFSYTVASITALLLAISPWHIYLSRLGHESNAFFSFFVFGVLFFLKWVRSKSWIWLFVGGVFFTLSMVSYYAGQVIVPLFILAITILYHKELWTTVTAHKKIVILLAISLIVVIPLVYQLFSPSALVRFRGTSTFTPEAHGDLFKQRVALRNKAVEDNNIIGRIFYSSHLYPVQVFINGYLDPFNPAWLFSNSSREPHKVPNMGVLYIWQIPFILIGLGVLAFYKKLDTKSKILIVIWFLFAPLPGAIATQSPHAMRVYTMLVPWQIITAFGLTYCFFKLKRFKYISIILFVALILYSLSMIKTNYYEIFPKQQSDSFEYALSKAIPYVIANQNNYKKIVFSNKDNLYQSYMLFLFHTKYDPALYQKYGGTKSGGYAEPHAFDKYEFRPIDLKKEQMKKGVLYLVNVNEGPDNGSEIKTFKNLDGKDAIKVYTFR